MSNTLNLRETGEGVCLPVKVRAGGRKNEFGGIHAGMLRVEITTVPEKGKANKVVLKLLANSLGIAQSQLDLIQGQANTQKVFLIKGLTVTEILARLHIS